MGRRSAFAVVFAAVGLVLTAWLGSFPGSSEGACGAAASSCKNCHEVKAEMPVSAKGDYHVQHAFGDFCVFCHSGNTAAADKAGAHQGMVKPLADLQKSCASCHPDDFEKRAQGYGAGTPAQAREGAETATAAVQAPEIPPPTPDPAKVAPEDLVDYNRSEAGEERAEAIPEAQEVAAPEKAAAPAGPVAEEEGGGSRAPVIVGIVVIIGVVIFLLFRKK